MYKTEEGLSGFDWDNLDVGKRVYNNNVIYGKHKDVDDLLELYNGDYNIIEIGKIYEGFVRDITDTFVIIDVNAASEVYVYTTEFNTFEYNNIKLAKESGRKISVKVLKQTKDLYIGSIKEAEHQSVFENIYKAAVDKKNREVFEGYVVKHIENVGYIIQINGISTFMPGSFASLNFLTKDESEALVGKYINVIPVSYSKQNNNIIVSHKAYLQQLIPNKLKSIKNNDKNEVYIGKVTGVKKFGIFVEFEELLTGMIHYSCYDDLTADLIAQNLIVPGDLIKFKVKEIQDKKIILTQK